MTILREREVWRRTPTVEPKTSRLTPEERENVKIALRILRKRAGSYRKLGFVTRLPEGSLRTSASRSGDPSPGLALALARVARAPVEDILSGAWPYGVCPLCKRST